jgi:hypothetical protein
MVKLWEFLKKDFNPKYIQTGILASYALVARELYTYEKSHLFTLAMVLFSILVDQGVSYWEDRKFRLSLTPVIIGLGISLLIDTNHLWVYLFAVLAANLSKILIKIDGKHIYNPGAFGVAFTLLFFNNYVSGNLNLFNGDILTSSIFFGLGLANVIYARMYKMSLYWLLFFLAINVCAEIYQDAIWQVPLLIMLNPSFIIFTFHMISDPRTVPIKQVWVVALIYAVIDFILRVNKYPNSFYHAVIIGQSILVLYSILRKYEFGLRKAAPVFVMALFIFQVVNLHYQHPAIIQHRYPAHIKNRVKLMPVNDKLGINFVHTDPPEMVKDLSLARTYLFHGSVNVGDFNNDGWQDFFVVNSYNLYPNHLYLNNKGKGFIESAQKWNIAIYPSDPQDGGLYFNVSSTVFDYDGDGDQDIYISRIGCDLLYKNLGDKFELVADDIFCKNSKYAFPFDYDKDGDFDLLLLRYLPKEHILTRSELFIEPPANSYDAQNGTRNYILINEDGKFRKHEDPVISSDTRYSFDATIIDPYSDGDFYLALVNDFGTNRYYQINNNYKLNENIYEKDRRNSMNIHSHYQTNETLPEVYISNIYLKDMLVRGNFLYKAKTKTNSRNIAYKMNVNKCGWAWGGVFNDYNLDGYNDIYITNGLLSIDRFKNLNQNNQSYSFVLYKNFSQSQLELLGVPRKDFNQRDDILWLLLAAASFQKDCLFIYDPQSKEYINVGSESGITESWDGRSVATIDYDNDGDLDVIVAMQNGKLKFLQNTINDAQDKNWIGLKLNSKNYSNKLGTKIMIEQGNDIYRKEFIYGKSGFLSQSDPRVHFGLKSNEDVLITIILPGKNEFTFKQKTPVGKYYEFDLDSIK